jgi:hypothetical protein
MFDLDICLSASVNVKYALQNPLSLYNKFLVGLSLYLSLLLSFSSITHLKVSLHATLHHHTLSCLARQTTFFRQPTQGTTMPTTTMVRTIMLETGHPHRPRSTSGNASSIARNHASHHGQYQQRDKL